MKIKIRDKEYELKITLRAMFVFEQIKGSMFKIETLTDEFLYFFSLLLANNKDLDISFDELIDEIDKDPSLMNNYKAFMDEQVQKQSVFKTDEIKDDKKKVCQ